MTLASFIHRYEEHGGGDLPAFSWAWEEAPPTPGSARSTRSTASCSCCRPGPCATCASTSRSGALHGYDLDFCLQVREAGRKVVTADFRAIHTTSSSCSPDPEEWIQAHMRVAEKWDGRMPGVGPAPGTWKERARRAEAEPEAARTILPYLVGF